MAATFNNPNNALPADVMTPGVGQVTFFYDISNGGKLSYMTPDRVVHVVVDSDANCCACDIAKSLSDSIACALQSGQIDLSELTAFLTQGVEVKAVESEVDGVKTCTVTLKISPAA